MKYIELIQGKDDDKISYFDLLSCDEWKAKRLTILNRDSHKCCECNRTKTIKLISGSAEYYYYNDENNKKIFCKEPIYLHIHHKLYILNRLPWEYDSEHLQTLCSPCHERLHNNEDVKVWDERQLKILEYGSCDRCSGKGYIKQYKHVEGGRCFKCLGHGYILPLLTIKRQ